MILASIRSEDLDGTSRASLHKRHEERQHIKDVVNQDMTTRTEEKERFWNKVLFEVLESQYVTDYIGSVLKDIKDGRKAFEESNHAQPYGFGEGCYYATKRKLVEDVVYQYFDEETETQSPTLVQWIVERVRSEVEGEIDSWRDIEDNMGSRFGRAEVQVSVDYSAILREARDNVEARLKTKTEAEIEFVCSQAQDKYKE